MIENTDFNPPKDPWGLFQEWFALAQKHEINDPNAMSLATMGADGMPSLRVVLMKDCDEKGLVFYTNRQSRKGQQLALHPKAAICLYWKSLHRQIRIEGLITEVRDAESDAYYASRPRGSQIGAWASHQSRPLEDRATLERRVSDLEKQFEGKSVPRPPQWGGYLLTPLMLEFWQDRHFRLHDRIVYKRVDVKTAWTIQRLNP